MKGLEIISHANLCWNFQPEKQILNRKNVYDVQISVQLS